MSSNNGLSVLEITTARFTKRHQTRTSFFTGLALAACMAASCGDAELQQSLSDAADETAAAVSAEAAALMDSANAGMKAAQAAHAEGADDLADNRTSALESIGYAFDAVSEAAEQLFAGTREDLVTSIEAQLATADAQIDALKASLGQASAEAQVTLGFQLAALDSKRFLVAARLTKIGEAGADAWQVHAPDLEEGMEKVNAALVIAQDRFDEAIEKEAAPANDWFPGKPKELFEVIKVVDGDTVHIKRNNETQKLRLLSVDTEEKLSGRAFNPAKPETLFGEETKLWAIDFFNELADEDGVIRVGVIFPGGVEASDVYGRLLCHVVLPDGKDFNLQLVEEGWSPYFTKYGYSKICHKAFQAAEAEAKKNQLGIWNPEVNKPADADAPWNKRDYAVALPWWHARADAIQAFRDRTKSAPDSVVDAEDEAQLEAAMAAGEVSDYPKTVFGAVDRSFEEDDGSLTLLFRAGNDQKAFRAKIAKEMRPKLAAMDLANRGEGGVQNYLFVTGTVVEGPRGFDINLPHESAISLGAPDPVFEKE